MKADAMSGGFADAPIEAAHGFRAILGALSCPGAIVTVAGAAPPPPLSPAAGLAALVLFDGTTPVCLTGAHDSAAVRDWIGFHTGAPLVGPGQAMFALGDWVSLQPVTRFAIGTPEYPDRAATLIVEMDSLDNSGALLRGPGIGGTVRLSLPDIAAFQANRALFPLGFDTFLTCGGRLAGVPRSTIVEAG
ncbi:MAG: alpha-D-ribose 1-methylphosphonate 5-triphosphate synthase subunit PhnH [Rhodobacteraceae bacterium HLUCCA12]|nr:MAG: alpha-D-ribose 1-methylphosphonate 5-triphosphate synthase subunit PhnH [Rhodobacteraceae bacterium HLUCCA12]